jgi:organic radical activating enzyme
MYIADTVFSLTSQSYEVYVNGCKPKMIEGKRQHCPGCHNTHLFSFKNTDNTKTYFESIKAAFNGFSSMIKFIWILGGEPLDQKKDELKDLITFLRQFNKPIILFTGYDLNVFFDEYGDLDVDYVKHGYYDATNKEQIYYPELQLELIGSNQRIYDVKNDVNLVFIVKHKETA